MAPLACLFAAIGVLVLTSHTPQDLAAGTKSKLGPDNDSDGLADAMEEILGTSPDDPDTDGDSYHDLEELARGSDPLDQFDFPVASELSVGVYSYTDAGYFNLHTAIYIEAGNFNDLEYELGIVVNDLQIPVNQAVYSTSTRAFFYAGVKNPNDRIVVLEMPIPDDLVSKVGDFGIYSIVRDNGSVPRPPAVGVVNLAEIGGITMEIAAAPRSLNKGGGIVYRPLSGKGSPPIASTSGQICWQGISAVGTSGASILYEVDAASCEDFDSFCGSADCAAKVGTLLSLPDPGTLLGG